MALSPPSPALTPALAPLSQSPQPPRAGNCHAGPVRLHQLNSSLGLLGLDPCPPTSSQERVRSSEESSGSMRRTGVEPVGGVSGAEGGVAAPERGATF